MKILCINTAFSEAQICFDNEGKKSYNTMDSNCKHSENVLVNIDKLLDGVSINDIDVCANVVGPGSFTGIRISTALVKGFMTANTKLKAVAINSLELMAYEFLKTKPKQDFWCVLNALSGNFFVAKYNKLGEQLEKPMMATPELIEKISNDFCVGLIGEATEFANEEVKLDVENLLIVAQNKIDNKLFVKENELLPLYLRLSQAEANLKQDEKNGN